MKTLCILGRQPGISVAELESLYGNENVSVLNDEIALVHAPIEQDRLGGTQKTARLYSVVAAKDWKAIEEYLVQTLPVQLADMPDRKIHLGFSVYGLQVSLRDLQKTTFAVKKALKKAGRSVRIVPNKHLALSSAQVFHNHFTEENGAEIIICKDKNNQLHIGKTLAVQDIDAYTARDQQRPKRDAKVGMLPPKLAQIIINLAVDQSPVTSHQSQAVSHQKRETEDKRQEATQSMTVLDPFCGTGVVLQEALLMGFTAHGSDIDERMVEYTEKNLAWLTSAFSINNPHYSVTQGDATSHTWKDGFTTIAGEAYLGRPFSAAPDKTTLKKVMQDVDTITNKFLENVARQTEPGFRMCIAVPAWHVHGSVHRLKTLASLEKLGYTRQSFVHVEDEELIYHRKNQIVARELVVLTRT